VKPYLEFKGYFGSAEISQEDNVLHGKLLFIKDVISYEGDTPKALEQAFREAVEDYLKTCSACGDTPDKPCKGTFRVSLNSTNTLDPQTFHAAKINPHPT
jgi:predicted HicB family RNase H-like nuclease